VIRLFRKSLAKITSIQFTAFSRLWLALVLVSSVVAFAADLKIGLKAEVNNADPHVLGLGGSTNRNVWQHVYEPLVGLDDRQQVKPLLATSWRTVNELTWEFKLRPKVVFHDGSPLTAEDVKFSLERAMGATGPRTFRTYVSDIASISIADAQTVLIKTKVPSPALPKNISTILIVSKRVAIDATENTFAVGKTAVGTGAYRFVEWRHGERIVLAKNDHYWGENEPWDTVILRFIPKDPARAAALLAGAVDVIDGAPISAADAFNRNNKVNTISVTSYMLNYVVFDQFRRDSPYIKDNDGNPLGKNPFVDRKVREALTIAIDRDAITKHVMKGAAEPSGQIVPPGFFGHDPSLKAKTFNFAEAKRLLADAGYPNGFRITLHCTNDRYLNDAKVCEALGQMFSKIGIKTEVKTMPSAVFLSRATGARETEFSIFLIGIGAVTGESMAPLVAISHTINRDAGLGANNYGRYSNPQTDELINTALRSMDPMTREEALKSAAKMLIADVGIMPIHFLKANWATRKSISIKPRSDGFTLAMNIRAIEGQ
jgi:peptide/nickel transport system substrate-binding protein